MPGDRFELPGIVTDQRLDHRRLRLLLVGNRRGSLLDLRSYRRRAARAEAIIEQRATRLGIELDSLALGCHAALPLLRNVVGLEQCECFRVEAKSQIVRVLQH